MQRRAMLRKHKFADCSRFNLLRRLAPKVLYGALECPSNKWKSVVHQDLVIDRVKQACVAGAALKVHLEIEACDRRSPASCLNCDGLREIFDLRMERNYWPECSEMMQYTVSSAPSVTPIRIQSPTMDDWLGAYSRSSAFVGATPSWRVGVCILGLLGTVLGWTLFV